MKKLKILFGTVILSAGLASCSSAYYASAGYASDDLYAVHDRAEISRRKQAEAEAQRAAAEARRAEWEARIAEAKAAAAENSYYEYRSADANPYESVLADDYESAYARRLRGFESPTYKMPSSYINARYGSAFNYVSAYDPAFYNIVVMGDQARGQAKALNQQKTNVNVSNVISADQIGRFPDSNIGDALKRVPGIAMQNDQGEARNIVVRGLASELNSVTLNGNRIPSAEGDNRKVQMDVIPSDMIQTIEVNKTLTPDMDADAIHRRIDKPHNQKHSVQGSVQHNGWNGLQLDKRKAAA